MFNLNLSCKAVATGVGQEKVQTLKMDEHIAATKREVALMRMDSSSALLNLQNPSQHALWYCWLNDGELRGLQRGNLNCILYPSNFHYANVFA